MNARAKSYVTYLGLRTLVLVPNGSLGDGDRPSAPSIQRLSMLGN